MEEITDKTLREKILTKELKTWAGITPFDEVECLHCGQTYHAGEMQVYKKDDEYMVCCKNYPRCSGTIIDIM